MPLIYYSKLRGKILHKILAAPASILAKLSKTSPSCLVTCTKQCYHYLDICLILRAGDEPHCRNSTKKPTYLKPLRYPAQLFSSLCRPSSAPWSWCCTTWRTPTLSACSTTPSRTSAVTLAAPMLLAFNAVNNLFGVGSSSLMSRSLGCKDYDMVSRSSAFGFYCALFSGIIFSILCASFNAPLLGLLGADETTWDATCGVHALDGVFRRGALDSERCAWPIWCARRAPPLHASIGTMSGCLLNIVLDPIFIMPWGLGMGAAGAGLATFISNCVACLYFLVLHRRAGVGAPLSASTSASCSFNRRIVRAVCGVGVPAAIQNLLNVTGMTILNNFTSVYKRRRRGRHGHRAEDQTCCPCTIAHGPFPGRDAAHKLQLLLRQQQENEGRHPLFRRGPRS